MPSEDETREADDRVTAELQRAEYILRSMLFANNEVMRRFGQDLPPIEREQWEAAMPAKSALAPTAAAPADPAQLLRVAFQTLLRRVHRAGRSVTVERNPLDPQQLEYGFELTDRHVEVRGAVARLQPRPRP